MRTRPSHPEGGLLRGGEEQVVLVRATSRRERHLGVADRQIRRADVWLQRRQLGSEVEFCFPVNRASLAALVQRLLCQRRSPLTLIVAVLGTTRVGGAVGNGGGGGAGSLGGWAGTGRVAREVGEGDASLNVACVLAVAVLGVGAESAGACIAAGAQ